MRADVQAVIARVTQIARQFLGPLARQRVEHPDVEGDALDGVVQLVH